MSYPQPHEGITGADREADDLLSLDDKATARRMLMIGMAECLHQAALVGNPAPVVKRMYGRMKDPQPGDLVLELSSLGVSRRRPDGLDQQVKAFGILLAHRREWWQTDEEWAARVEEERIAHEEFLRSAYSHPGDEPFDPAQCERLTDDAWYVQYGAAAGDVCRWTNCQFVAIPTDPRASEIPVGTRDGNGVTFTRDDLISGLADSGFAITHGGAG